ncbi:hypothetical protein E6C27_scaffold190G001400 [Cucumis melo var. makuwa]|uniref:Uncharacterized protein n=1 Tax=Cucumis melo var. makuwa TaxID=1194695 RepID=A0A5A7UCH4_CUCMM|nr:hypothetical protein E6C27_scaffold190G001400 [Cucumis melo var. makuwa]
MARHGHFWSLASLPLPLPRPLPEKHDMKRDMLVCSEPGGNTKTIGMRGPHRVTRVISISMLDWRPVGPHSPKYVVIPKDTHAGGKGTGADWRLNGRRIGSAREAGTGSA